MTNINNVFTHLDKVFWPSEGYTKGDVIQYYDRISNLILPYLKGRPMVLNRHPNGIKGSSFFQKNVDPNHLPQFVRTFPMRAKSTQRTVHYIVCDNKQTLLYLANLGCIEMHPWSSRIEDIHKPDFLTIDLDPGRRSFEDVITVSRFTHDIIESAEGKSVVKTSGKAGMHIFLPLVGKENFEYVREVARKIALRINRELPSLTTLERHPAKRGGKIYLDYLRNSIGQTLAAPYSLRAYPAATVSTPLEWSEVRKGLRPDQFTIRTIFRRLKLKDELWNTLIKRKNRLQKISRRLD